jgi:hypothetical protein
MSLEDQFRIAAIVPCHNEEAAIAKVVTDLRRSVPGMTVFVYDNASTDRTAEVAARAGAVVRSEPLKGKGNAVRRAFSDIDADIYLLIDGDDTYDAAAAPAMIRTLIEEKVDHVLGVRTEVRTAGGSSAYRPAHATGNRLLNRIVCAIFGDTLGDMLSGYRVFSRRFVKSFPALSRGFEIETELTVHALALRIPSTSVKVGFRDRAAGSESKLRTFRDGSKILSLILTLARHERPVAFSGLVALLLAAGGLTLGVPALTAGTRHTIVTEVPALFGATFLMLTSLLVLIAGIVVDCIRRGRHELARQAYLNQSPVVISEPLPQSPAFPSPVAPVPDPVIELAPPPEQGLQPAPTPVPSQRAVRMTPQVT